MHVRLHCIIALLEALVVETQLATRRRLSDLRDLVRAEEALSFLVFIALE